jgi:hypothetical protein
MRCRRRGAIRGVEHYRYLMVGVILKFSVFSSCVSEECADITLLVKGGAASVWPATRYAVAAARPLRELRSRLYMSAIEQTQRENSVNIAPSTTAGISHD